MQAIFAMDDTRLEFIQTSAPGKVRKRMETKSDRYEKSIDEKSERRLEMDKRPGQTTLGT